MVNKPFQTSKGTQGTVVPKDNVPEYPNYPSHNPRHFFGLLNIYTWPLHSCRCETCTNRYRLSLLDIIGVTPTGMTFSTAFAYLEGERVNNIVWALERFLGLFL